MILYLSLSKIARSRFTVTLICFALLMLALPPRSALAVSTELRRYPYLTDVVSRYATINWATDRSDDVGFVRWGKVGAESCTAHITPATRTNLVVNSVLEYQWKALLTLTPNSQYCYRVYLDNDPAIDLLGTDPSPQFWTQIPAGSKEAFSFAVFSDWGAVDETGSNLHEANVLSQVAASDARFALTVGDNANPSGTQKNYGDLQQTGPGISVVFGPTFWTVAGATTPIFPGLGNHGFTAADLNHPHIMNWPQDRAVTLSAGRYTKERYCCLNGTQPGDYPSVWYAFDAGLARFYVIQAAWGDLNVGTADSYKNDYDYHWAQNSAQYQWLKNDLETHPRALKFAFFQYPMYSDTSTSPSDTFLQGPDSLEGLLSRYEVNIGFNSHAHNYQRFHKPHPGGLITYVSGGGGDRPASIGQHGCSAHNAYGIGWSNSNSQGNACGSAPIPQAIEQVHHFLLIRVEGTTVTVSPTDELGRTFDVQTYDFSASPDEQAPTTPTPLIAQAISARAIRLTWAKATDNIGVVGYSIYRDGVLLDTIDQATPSYDDDSATPLTTYSYTIDAFDAFGNHSGLADPAIVSTPDWSFMFLPYIRR